MIEILGKSKALLGTWFYLKQYKVLFDCGDGAGSTLGIANDDVYTIALTHSHLDHITGLVGVAGFQKRSRKRDKSKPLLQILYHKGFADDAMAYKKLMDHFGVRPRFREITEDEDIEIKKGVYLKPFLVDHTATYYRKAIIALGYNLIEKRKRLKPELAKQQKDLSKDKFTKLILDLKKAGKKEEDLMEEFDYKLVSYCGDGRPHNLKAVQDTDILMHEMTFIDKAEVQAAHSYLDPVLETAIKSNCKHLVLFHITEKYIRERKGYQREILARAKKAGLKCPVHIVPVGKVFRERFDV